MSKLMIELEKNVSIKFIANDDVNRSLDKNHSYTIFSNCTCLLVNILLLLYILGRIIAAQGSTELLIDFLQYENPKDQKSDGQDCDTTLLFETTKNLCDHLFTFCISSIGRRYAMLSPRSTILVIDVLKLAPSSGPFKIF